MTTKTDAQQVPVVKKPATLMRSPNYPGIGLPEAIEKVRILFEKEKRASTTPEIILGHFGYALNGASSRILAALKQYGLLDKEETGKYKISKLGFDILFTEEGSSEYKTLIKEAATKPKAFQELLKAYPASLPSDETLKSYLIKERGFNPESVGKFIRVFKSTMGLATLSEIEYNKEEEGFADEKEASLGGHEMLKIDDASQTQKRTEIAFGTGMSVNIWTLSGPRNIKAELRLSKDVKKEDINRLKKHIDLLCEGLLDSDDDTI